MAEHDPDPVHGGTQAPGQEGGPDPREDLVDEDNPYLEALLQELDQGQEDAHDTQEARNELAISILSSASARRKIRKADHCKFCNSFNGPMDLRAHLEEREDCFILYCRMMHYKTPDALLSSLFTCLFCSTNDAQLASHLKSHNQCYQRYCEKFDVKSIR